METPVFNPFVAAINGSLYVAGGTSATGGSDALQIFLPHWTSTFGIWQTRTPMPEIRAQGCGAAVLGDDLYVLGGWAERPSGDGLPHRDVFVFESRRNRWRPSRPSEDEKKMPSLPTRSAQGIAGVIDGKVYVTTGARGVAGEWPGFLHVYDPKPNFWKQLASSAMPHVSGAGGVIRGKLYLTGGLCRIGGEYKDGGMTEAYDPSSNTWTSKRSMPTARGTCASVVLSNKLYVIGGHDGTNRVTVVESYDPAADEWASEPSLLRARDGCGAAVVNGVIYVFSGVVDRTGKPAEVMETWRPGGKWTAKVIETPMPFAVSCAFVAVVNDRIYVAGGSTQRRSTAETQAYRPENNWWGSIRPMPEARYLGSGTAVLNDEIYCFGGWDDLPGSEQLPHADVFVYNILLNQWRRSSSSNPAGN